MNVQFGSHIARTLHTALFLVCASLVCPMSAISTPAESDKVGSEMAPVKQAESATPDVASKAPTIDASAKPRPPVKGRRFRWHQVFDGSSAIMFQSNFDKDPVAKWSISRDGNYNLLGADPKRLAVVPIMIGEKPSHAVRFYTPRALDSYRSELSLPSEPGFHERWYAEYIYVPESWVIDSSRGATIVMQWHGIPGNWRATYPNFDIAIKGDEWEARQSYGAAQTGPTRKRHRLTSLRRGVWTQWILHAKWSAKDDGLVEIWQNGKRVIQIKGQNLYSTIGIDYTPYLKAGIYHPEWKRKDEKHNRRFEKEETPVRDKTVYVSRVVVGSEKATYETMLKALGPMPTSKPGTGQSSKGQSDKR